MNIKAKTAEIFLWRAAFHWLGLHEVLNAAGSITLKRKQSVNGAL
jgi:hypothetical protein